MFPIPSSPGVYKDDTPLEAGGYFIDTDKIRFVRGLPQTFGGWEAVTSSALSGKCRGVCSWADLSNVKWAGLGTHSYLYALTDAVLYDITPITSRGQLASPFTTTLNSASVSVAHTAHGRAVGDRVAYSGASAVGGLTITGAYTVVTAATDSYTITAASQATSSAGPGGGTVNFKYYLAIGLADATGALGYGTGPYSTSGAYSAAGTGAAYLRTWSMTNWAQNLIACPRGGAIYEWAPATSAAELVQNGDFSSGTGWTANAGWVIGGNIATATLANLALTQTVTCTPMAYYVLECDVTWSAGSLQISLNGNTIGAAIGASANIQRTIYVGNAAGAVTLAFTGTGFTGTVDNVTLKQMLTAEAMTNAPTQNTCALVTPDGVVMAFGTTEVATGNFNPMHVRWSAVAPNHHTWTPATGNLAGFYTLGVGSRIVTARQVGTETVILTDKAAYAATFTFRSDRPYAFRQIAGGAGCIGANAAAVLSGILYWMAPDGQYYRYAGGAAEPMQSTIQRDVFDNIAYAQQDKVFAAPISQYQNVIFLYPDKRDGTNEVSRYALLCAQEPAAKQGGGPVSLGCWAPGTFTRTAWMDACEGIFQFPIAADAGGMIYYQEKGNTADGGNIAWRTRHAGIELGDGTNLWMMTDLTPDFEDMQGGCTLTAYAYNRPQSTPTTHGPFNITAATEKLDMLTDPPTGRMVVFEFQGNAAPAFMRYGKHMMSLADTGMEF